MPRIDVPFTIEKQHITQPTRDALVSGGQNYFYATFTVCEKWSDINGVKAVFVRDDISKLIDLTETETGYECEIPWEVMCEKGSFQVGIFGGDRLLTDYAYVIVKQGCVIDGESPLPPTPDWFIKIENELKNITVETDNVLDENSYNAISNKAVTTAFNDMGSEVDEVVEQTEILKADVEGIQKQINEHAHFKGYKATNAEILEIEATPNDFAYSAESGTKWIYSEENGWQDSGVVVPDQLTPASELTPLIDGEASVGESESYARGDHRHPTDTTRASVEELNALKSDIATAAIIDTKTGAIVTIKDAANATLLDFTVNDDTPVESLKIVGKNVFHRDYATPVTNIGVTAEWNPDNQEFILNGTTTAPGDIKLATNMQIDWVPNEKYLVSVRQVGGTAVLADGTNASTTYAWGIFQDNAAKYTRGSTSNKAFVESYSFTATAFALDAERTYIFYFQCWRPGTVFDNYRVKVQIEKGTTMTDWEPYKGENIAIDDVKSYVLPKGYSKLTPVPSANISVEYVVDTKLYIDNKIAESALPNGDEVSY